VSAWGPRREDLQKSEKNNKKAREQSQSCKTKKDNTNPESVIFYLHIRAPLISGCDAC